MRGVRPCGLTASEASRHRPEQTTLYRLAHGFLRLRCGECSHDKLRAIAAWLLSTPGDEDREFRPWPGAG